MCHRGGLQTFVHKKIQGRTAALLFWPPTTAASLNYKLPALLARTTTHVQVLAGTFHTQPEQGSTLGKSIGFLKENTRGKDCHRADKQEWVSPEKAKQLQQLWGWAWPWSEGTLWTQWHDTKVASSPEDFQIGENVEKLNYLVWLEKLAPVCSCLHPLGSKCFSVRSNRSKGCKHFPKTKLCFSIFQTK